MKRYISFTSIMLIIVFTSSTIIFAFSIFTNSSGYARRYLDSDIPFIYKLNNTTPPEFVDPIDAGAQVWEDVVSSYWEFENGGQTTASSAVSDGTNLIFFDLQGVNFGPPGSNTIAFSRTWTLGSGSGYHAVESDLIWNARDFPPSPTGASGQQDLPSVIAHELGHHLGLGHAGPAGGPPGVGPLIIAATMYGFSSSGDTTKRSLHIDDIAGVSAIYPVWFMQGTITDASSGLSIDGAALTSETVFAAEVGLPIFGNDRYQRPGYFRDTLLVASDGAYETTVLAQNFDLTVVHFGYEDQFSSVFFNNPGGIGQTQTINLDIQLQLSPLATVSGTVTDSISGDPIQAAVKVLVTSNKPGKPVGFIADTTTGSAGDFEILLPAMENYLVLIQPEPPYPEVAYAIENLPQSGTVIDFRLTPADLLLVNDDPAQNYEDYFITSIQNNGLVYHAWRVSESGVPDSSVYERFPEPRRAIWFTGDDNTDVLTAAEQQSLAKFLDSGGNLLLTGQNIAETSSNGILLTNYLGVSFDMNVASPIMVGVAGDPIGDGLFISTVAGAGNQNSRDAVNLTGNGISFLNYGTTTPLGISGVRVENSQNNWKAVFLGFGMEGINNSAGMRDTLLQRVFTWFDVTTAIEGDGSSLAGLILEKFHLTQNYPNPFNSTTEIKYDISSASDVVLEIYTVLGQKVITLINKKQQAGRYAVSWEGRDNAGAEVSSGIYLYRIRAGSFVNTKKMIVIK